MQCGSMSLLRALKSQYHDACLLQRTASANNKSNCEFNAKAKGWKMHVPVIFLDSTLTAGELSKTGLHHSEAATVALM